jgi:hypothetical protein
MTILLESNYLEVMNDFIEQIIRMPAYTKRILRFIDAKGNLIRRCKLMDERQSAG